ncbi:hypothetical protein FHETE_4561 [Fusarium heterosporum]|uniref:Uncharacterized protein n=1 Tax=Fusarium heterosporum TaxID=42747 RepID=A0A8H5TFR4_FUSHE|nr:hypothetical protein FHETE_4561 [Fusarium heterosporum]
MPPTEKKWDSNAERDLCVAIIMGAADGERMRYNWPKVHNSMEALGYSFTKDAISQHFSKSIMRDFKTRHGAVSSSNSPTPTPKKAVTRKRAAPRKKNVTSDGGDEENDEVDESTAESPALKKMKRKKEEEEDDYKMGHSNSAQNQRERSATAAADVGFENWLAGGSTTLD